jgi:hypothetical protein
VHVCVRGGVRVCVRVRVRVCVHVRVCVRVYKCGMPDCPASNQSGTGMIKTNGTGTNPVPDQASAVQHFFGPVPD